MTSVSVVIPAYNAAKHIAQTIQSLQQQSFHEFEIIVVNDASQDETLEILATLQEPKLRVVPGEHRGVSAARNRGIAASRGEWIAFLDADDVWAPDKLEHQLEACRHDAQAGLCYSWFYFWQSSTTPETKRLCCPRVAGTTAYRTLAERNVMGTGSNIMVRRSAIEAVGGFDESLTHGEDWEFCFRVALRWSVVLVPQALVYYRQHDHSSCSNFEKAEASTLKAIAKIFSQAPAELQSLKPKVSANFGLYMANLYLNRTQTAEGLRSAQRHWRKILQQYPTFILEPEFIRLSLKLGLRTLWPLRNPKALVTPRKTGSSNLPPK